MGIIIIAVVAYGVGSAFVAVCHAWQNAGE